MAVSVNKADLEFILAQIEIAEAHAAGQPLFGPTGLIPAHNIAAGLRTVDGTYNHLLPGQERWGAADQQFPTLLPPVFRPADGTPLDMDGPGPAPAMPTAPTYAPSNNPNSIVVDSSLRTISNLIVDQTISNPAAVETYVDAGFGVIDDDGVLHHFDADAAGNLGAIVGADESLFIPNVSPDVGLSASFNSWFTLFGQFFDHGLDLVNKGGSGTVFIPLQPDDPLYVPGGQTNFMVLTRATVSAGPDGLMNTPDDVRPVNTTTSFVDQNQTYTSHSSHQVFLRQYVLNADGDPVATGKLIEGGNGGMATWAEVKAQARDFLGIELTDFDVGSVPLLRTDQYGNFIPAASGFPQVITGIGLDGIPNTADDVVVSGTPGAPVNPTTAGALRTGHAFLADIAHEAVPIGKIADGDITIGLANPGNGSTEYDNELLDAHFIAGDGRVNENIGLTAVHHVFHAEHNRMVDVNKSVILETGDIAFINQWLVDDIASIPADTSSLVWDGERLFQSAKFTTEMQYQHLVFEEFARKVQPQINPFLVPDGFDVTINPSIVAEFAHVVYRFGHSMLTESIDRFDPGFNADHIGLIQGFLNPVEFDNEHAITDDVAAGAIIRGMTRQVGNEIDEFVTGALRNNLLGLPLDLATINLARGRDTGVPSLNAARREFYEATNSAAELRPYDSWVDFAGSLKHEASIVNFVAAYGKHTLITGETTMEGKRAATLAIITGQAQTVFGEPGVEDDRTIAAPTDAVEFLNSEGAWTSGANGVTITGLDDVDLWIGGLAEKILPFGGMLGSTFNFVFEAQMEALQNGDRFYYLQRLDGLHLFGEMENNSFAEMIMTNTNATHLPSDVFSVPGLTLEVNQALQFNDLDGNGTLESTDPSGGGILTPLVVRNNPGTVGPDTNYLRYTGDQHVVLGGTSGNDIMTASEGDDTIHGDAGNDKLEGGAGNDIINGGSGNDIIRDLGGDDNIKAGEGNDVVHGGPGLDLIMGGAGQDFIVLGTDAGSEVFAGEGNDFVLGSKNAERILGNEGDDWIETGTFDGAPGDSFDEIFARDGIVGHDVFFGDGGFDEFISEGGDDIMVGSPGPGKLFGMSGFDWATYKNSTAGVNGDFFREAFDVGPIPPGSINLETYEAVEGLSGSAHNDILRGSDDDAAARLPISAGGASGFTGSALDAAGIARIAGLQAVVGAGVTAYSAGDIILGGDGSDLIQGRGGDDIIDGDKWLNVRISVREGVDANGNPTGAEIASHNSMTTLVNAMFAGTYNPGQLQIVREILTADGAGDVDTAVYAGAQGDYAFGATADGRLTVTDVSANPVEGTDTLDNIEQLQFADGTVGIIVGTAGPDVLNGTAGNDLILGLGGADTLNGLAGNDLLVGGTGNDILNGGLGNDTYSFGLADGSDTINEPVSATSGGAADRIVIQAGGTALTGLNASDNNTGTANGSLVINFNGQTVTVAGHYSGNVAQTGIEAINFTDGTFGGYLLGSGDYLVSRADPAGAVFGLGPRTVNLGASTANNFVAGESGNDVITGGSGNDLLFGGGGDNDLFGGAGDDLLVGGGGAGDNDLLDGGLGIDTMVGLGGNDTYIVDEEFDVVVEALGGGTDVVETVAAVYSIELMDNVENLTYTGLDADNFTGTGNALANVISGGDLDDLLTGLAGADTLNGGVGDDTLLGGDGNDTLVGGDGNDTLNGGNDVDTASYAGAAAGVTVSLALGGAQNTVGAGIDTLTAVENLLGSGNNDTLTGNVSANTLAGGGGNDTLNATVDNVRDTLDGGANTDTANYAAYGVALTVSLGGAAPIVVGGSGSTAATSDVIVSIENFTGGSAGDTITGSTAANTLNGGLGNDTFNYSIGGGADTIIGGGGADVVNITGAANNDVLDVTYSGGALITGFEGGTVATVETINANLGGNADTLSYGTSASAVTVNLATNTASGLSSILNISNATGGNGADTLTGSAGANTLNGGAGSDNINGGAGADILIGGNGADTLNSGAANDNLMDVFRFTATAEFGDTVNAFDADGADNADDQVQFTGALNTAYDDGAGNDAFLFASGNGAVGAVTVTVGQGNTDAEALLLTGANGEGVAQASLGSAALVSAAFNAEFAITAANGEDALLVVNDTNANSFSVWQWIQAGGGETAAGELSLVGIFNANATVSAGNFDFA